MSHPLLRWRRLWPVALPTTQPTAFVSMPAAFDQLIEDFYQEAFNLATSSVDQWENLALNPSVDVLEDANEFKIEIEMPGMGPEDVRLSIEDNKLTIVGEKTASKIDQEKNYTKREIAYGNYQRTIQLPDYVDASQVRANFRKGMLWITLPKRLSALGRTKEIQIESI